MNRSVGRSAFVLLCCLGWPVLLGARGCEPDPVPIGGDTCDPSRCGTPLGLPAITCADGSTGGNTGVCLASSDGASCAWQIRECPVDTCTATSCGPIPPVVPGTQLDCERVADGSCSWVVKSDPTCTPAECGPIPSMPSYTCADGSTGGFTGRCIGMADGSCGWEVLTCDPTTDCTLADCGPMPGSPAIVCADGSIGANTGRCLRDPTTAACGWEQRACPDPGSACAGLAGTSCASGEACIFPVGQCRTPDEQGVCTTPPEVCTAEWAPVCGCDDHTYSNVCTALGHGVSILHDGECAGSGTSCGGFGGATCGAGEYCNYPVDPTTAGASCGAADGTGTCTAIPETCTNISSPVCACDNHTYANDCFAAMAGYSVAHTGACSSAGFACGPSLTCNAGEYCSVTIGGAVGSAPRYACQTLPTSCAAAPSCTSCFPSGDCSADAAGNITLTFAAP